MSIYATWLALDGDDEHKHPECAAYKEDPEINGVWEFTGEPCNCPARFEQPLVYRGSHVLPKDDDQRGGFVMVCSIPNHIQRSVGVCPLAREHTYKMLPGPSDLALRMERVEDCPHDCGLDGVLLSPQGLHDFLRLSVRQDSATYGTPMQGDATVLLDRNLATRLRDTLTTWLDAKERW